MRNNTGFTLLEVMGAVLIMGLLGTSLMTATLESTRRTGNARDQLTASLLADSALADVTAGLRTDSDSSRGEERDIDGYRVSVQVSPVDATRLGLGPLVERERGEAAPAAFTAAGRTPPPLLQIRVEVSVADEVVSQRTSFLFDGRSSPALQDAFAEEPEPDA